MGRFVMVRRHPRARGAGGILVIVALAVVALGSAGAVAAREPVDPTTLTPPPPDFFNASCTTQGPNILCTLHFSDDPIVDEPSGIVCDGVELTFAQTRDVVGKRWYDADGLLLQRHFREDIAGTLTNPDTGLIVGYVQANTIVHNLAEPGNVESGTSKFTGGNFRAFIPGGRTILVDAGWFAIDEATGELVDWAGPKHLDDYYVRGDEHALDAICDAVAG